MQIFGILDNCEYRSELDAAVIELKAMFRIRIHWIRIWIQVFLWIRIRIQPVRLVKLIINFLIKNRHLLSPLQRTFFLFSFFFSFPFLGPNFGQPGSGSKFPIRIRLANWTRIESESNPDPDTKQCLQAKRLCARKFLSYHKITDFLSVYFFIITPGSRDLVCTGCQTLYIKSSWKKYGYKSFNYTKKLLVLSGILYQLLAKA
jgi:hypothetical protein